MQPKPTLRDVFTFFALAVFVVAMTALLCMWRYGVWPFAWPEGGFRP
jgi:hypothetical protein